MMSTDDTMDITRTAMEASSQMQITMLEAKVESLMAELARERESSATLRAELEIARSRISDALGRELEIANSKIADSMSREAALLQRISDMQAQQVTRTQTPEPDDDPEDDPDQSATAARTVTVIVPRMDVVRDMNGNIMSLVPKT